MIKLNVNVIKLLQVEGGLSNSNLAERTHIGKNQLSKLKLGGAARVADIEGMLKAFPYLRFEDLFSIKD
jgi:DNA-binding Xre family transcriptional regulator